MKKLMLTMMAMLLMGAAFAQAPKGAPQPATATNEAIPSQKPAATDPSQPKPIKADAKRPDEPKKGDQKVKVTPYGFVRNYFNYDSRRTYASNGSEYNIIPYDEDWNLTEAQATALGAERVDRNDYPTATFLALTSRIGLNLNGPVLLGAASSGKIEGDFAGFSTTNVIFRIRQAHFKLNWDNGNGLTQELLAGQAWHPLSGEIMPEVLGMAAGAPFRAHSRTPQLRYILYNGHFGLTAAALYQLQYMYNGPQWKDGKWTSTNLTDFANNAIFPEGFLGLNYKDEHIYSQLGIDIQPIRPRVFGRSPVTNTEVQVDELNVFSSPTFYFQYTQNKFALKFRTTYAQNTSQVNQLCGYAVTAENADGSWDYAPMRASISYLNFAFGKKYRTDLFFGYMKNLGAGETLHDFSTTSTPEYYIFMKGGNNFTHLNSVFRVAPSFSYNVKALNLGLEYEMNACTYGDINPDGSINTGNDNFHQVVGHRICALIKYNF